MKYVAIAFGIISLITFFMYGIDKLFAKRGKWRIPEKVLLGFSFFGGAIGGTLGMAVFKHKTNHWYFSAVNILGIIWQITLLIVLLALK